MYPKVNQNIVIEIRDNDKSFKSIVADISEKDLLIAAPLDRENIGLVREGTALNIYFLSHEKLYRFSTRMIEKINDKIPLYRITKPLEQEIAKIQRRDNYRIRTSLPLTLNETELSTIDLSVGGALISSSSDIAMRKGETVNGVLSLPYKNSENYESIPFKGIIKRIEFTKNQERKNFAIEFTNMDKRDKMKITQFSIERQRQKLLIDR